MRKATITIDVECSADDGYFEKECPTWVNDECKLNGPIKCEGSGPSSLCYGCRFCKEYDEYVEDE